MSIFRGKAVTSVYRKSNIIKSVYRGLQLVWTGVRSCFGSGMWVGDKTWIGSEMWRGSK